LIFHDGTSTKDDVLASPFHFSESFLNSSVPISKNNPENDENITIEARRILLRKGVFIFFSEGSHQMNLTMHRSHGDKEKIISHSHLSGVKNLDVASWQI
jgi:hypothetical protein